jgi:hypothetical protein
MPLFGSSSKSNDNTTGYHDFSTDPTPPATSSLSPDSSTLSLREGDSTTSANTTTGPPQATEVKLTMAEMGLVNKKAQIQGTVMGISGGLLFGQ